MNNERIGVIVPVYKTEKYVAECIESILAQTCTNFRLILVDDGSPDSAGTICDEYATKDQRITVIHQENAGVTRARARGVEEATDCEWITFVDSDDTIIPEALKLLHRNINEETDIILCSKYFEEKEIRCVGGKVFNKTEDIDAYLKLIMTINGTMPWNRLFRKNVITPSCFNLDRTFFWGEDCIMNIRIAFNSLRHIQTFEEPIYNHRIHNESVCYKLKLTPNYRINLFKKIYSSIPNKREFFDYKLWLWSHSYNNSLLIPAEIRDIQKSIINELNTINYKIDKFNKKLLVETNPIKRLGIILSRKCKNAFCHKLC